ncbi:MAG: hypothetical protein GX923_05855 [Clostridia bacterium]|nr:hypothetical protein [Clostridia bacterium]
MKSRLFVSIILATTLFFVGCSEVPLFEPPSSYLLPEIMVKTPATGPDGYNWNISDQGELILEKEGENVILEKGEIFLIEGKKWEFSGIEENIVILEPVIQDVDPMHKARRQLD